MRLLLVDDGSKDETFRLAEEFSSNNPHVHVHKTTCKYGNGPCTSYRV